MSSSSSSSSSFQDKQPTIPQLLHLKGTNKRLLICMVGLPARGKTYISKKLCRYLNWIGYVCNVFNIGDYRRRMFPEAQQRCTEEFWNPDNQVGMKHRQTLAKQVMGDLFKFLQVDGGQAAIYDGTNHTLEKRDLIRQEISEFQKTSGLEIQLLWLEIICEDQDVIDKNIREINQYSPEFSGVPVEAIQALFAKKMQYYSRNYQSLNSKGGMVTSKSNSIAESIPEEDSSSYLQNFNSGKHFVIHNIEGFLMSKLTFFVINLKVQRAPIYISRHGESEYNLKGLIGGDSNLSANGKKYAGELKKFFGSNKFVAQKELQSLSIWTSTLQRTLQTAEPLKDFDLPMTHWRALVEIQVGNCDHMTYAEIAVKYPEEYAARSADKLNYRYPQGGESYMDVIARIEPCILELERMCTPVLLVVHRAVARCFYSYFLDLSPTEIPHLDIPLHTVLKLVPKAYGCDVTRYKLGVESVDDKQCSSPKPNEEEKAKKQMIAEAFAQAKQAEVTTAETEQRKETVVHINETGSPSTNSDKQAKL